MAKKYNATEDEISFFNLALDPNSFSVSEDQVEEINVNPSMFGQEDNLGLFQQSLNSQPLQENSQIPNDLPWYESIPNSILKGIGNGLNSFGQAFGPLIPDNSQQFKQFLNQPEENKINSFQEFLNNNPQPSFNDQLNNLFPTNEGFAENTIARAGNILPFILGGGGGGAGALSAEARAAGSAISEGIGLSSGPLKEILFQRAKDFISPLTSLNPFTRSLLGGASGAAAEELGLPEWAQSLAEIPAQVAPGFGSRLIPNNTQAALVNDARNLGLTDAQITPLIQESRKARVLSKVASRRGKTEQALSDSYEAVGRVYNQLSSKPQAQVPLNEFQAQRVGAEIQERLSNMPSGVREVISQDLTDLLNSKMTGSDLINFYQDVNYYYGKGEKQLSLLKEPITTAIGQISPQLAQEFNVTNKLMSNYFDIAKQLKPSIASDFISASEGARLLIGAFTGNYPLLVATIGEGAARKLASGLLVSPRFQNLSKQMVSALNNNKLAAADKIYESMLSYAREEDPESAVYLQKAKSVFGDQSNFSNRPTK